MANIKESLQKYWLLLFALICVVIFGIIQPSYVGYKNLLNIVSNACIVSIMGCGLTCIFSCGQIDLAAGAELSLATVIMAVLLNGTVIRSYVAAFLITLIALAAVGAVNAFLHVKVGIPAFVTTLGISYVIQGIANALTGGRTLNNLANWPDSFTFLGQKYIFGLIPMPVIVLVIVAGIAIFYTEYTRMGKYLYAVGANPTACEYIGINAKNQKVAAFILCAVFCGMSGILKGSTVNAASATMGSSLMVSGITTVMLGATFNKVGVYNIPGTIVGALLMAIIQNGMLMLTSKTWLNDFVEGGLLLVSLVAVVLIRKKGSSR